MSLLFAVVIPLITVFAMLFFTVRFIFDKYNQTYVYFKEFEAKGRLKQHIIWILIIVIILSQLLNFAFLKVISGVNYILGFGVALVCLEIGLMVGLKIHQYMGTKRLSRRLAIHQMTVHDSNRHLLKLKASYQHPWFDQRDRIFDYYNERTVDNQRYIDLNVSDSDDFKSLCNLKVDRVNRALRRSIAFHNS